MIFKGGKVFIEDSFKILDFELENGKFSKIENKLDHSSIVYLDEYIVIPGLVDIHTHGIAGFDFGDASSDEMKIMADSYIKNGTTSVLPTLVSLRENEYKNQIPKILDNYSGNSPFVGINLEGPFINLLKKGAHNENSIQDINIELTEKLWNLSEGTIRLMTVAPELNGFEELYNYSAGKFKLSLGHSSCDTSTAKKAYNIGVNHVTHLFNAMNPLHHREPSIIGVSLENPMIKELICDGIHVDDTVLKALFRAYSDEIAMVSDSVAACSLGDGKYSLGGLELTVKDKKAILSDGTIAGSAYTLFDGLKHLVSIGLRLEDVIRSASYIPAKAIGLDDKIGSIKIGANADFIVCDNELNIVKVYKNGQLVN